MIDEWTHLWATCPLPARQVVSWMTERERKHKRVTGIMTVARTPTKRLFRLALAAISACKRRPGVVVKTQHGACRKAKCSSKGSYLRSDLDGCFNFIRRKIILHIYKFYRDKKITCFEFSVLSTFASIQHKGILCFEVEK